MKVMIPVDDLPYSFAALESVIQRKWPDSTEFALVRVIESNDKEAANEHSRHLDEETRQHVESTKKWLNGLARALAPDSVQKRVKPVILLGDIDKCLAEFARDFCPDYIVMGSHDRSPRQRYWLGSIAAKVAGNTGCSVELVRPGCLHDMLMQERVSMDEVARIDFTPKRIVIPVDLSRNSDEVTPNWLGRIGGLQGSKVALLTVSKTLNHSKNEEKLQSKLEKQAEQLRDTAGITAVEAKVVNGSPSSAILEFAAAWEADLILVSLKGESDGGELIAGSTAKAVLDGAHCSVVAVRPGFEKDFAFTWNKNKAYIC
ncbi:MAG: universal stress protein [Cyanobacteria bacterium HKST-UBA01]|nr:universal stress protein [Cyanobacteria bacterium HKST-UBA01]